MQTLWHGQRQLEGLQYLGVNPGHSAIRPGDGGVDSRIGLGTQRELKLGAVVAEGIDGVEADRILLPICASPASANFF